MQQRLWGNKRNQDQESTSAQVSLQKSEGKEGKNKKIKSQVGKPESKGQMEFIPKGSGCPGEKKAKRELTGSMAQTFSVLPSEEGGREGGGEAQRGARNQKAAV